MVVRLVTRTQGEVTGRAWWGLCLLLVIPWAGRTLAAPLMVKVFDAEGWKSVACRVYLTSAQGEAFTVVSDSPEGSAVVYDVQRGRSAEVHTTVSAHPFRVELPQGKYRLQLERGKEYVPLEVELEHKANSTHLTMSLERWIHMGRRGWYSGDTHVHRDLEDLPNLIMAEDLNVALPLTSWVTELNETPMRSSRLRSEDLPSPRVIHVDDDHVIWPINTEYEIFTVNQARHTLGAVFVLNHKEPIDLQAHPVRAVAREARRQGALLDLDKHNWPWSMMLLPTMEVDLFELTNNHLWRTEFLFKNWYPEYFPSYLELPFDGGSYSEESWIHWGFANYYALLNCGFDLMPSGGTASGVHPVPLGFGRVYVHTGTSFSYQRWMQGLERGNSFVTTGPMLDIRFNGQLPGARFRSTRGGAIQVQGVAEWWRPLSRVEIVVNGDVVKTLRPSGEASSESAIPFSTDVKVGATSWIAVRCFGKTASGRIRFAHSAPVRIDVGHRPLTPRREEVIYLMERVSNELERHRGVLPGEALLEYEEALEFYQSKLGEVR